MIMRRCNATRPVMVLRNQVDRIFGDCFEAFSPAEMFRPLVRQAFPPVNVWEDDRTLFAEVELPGMKMDDIEVFVVGDELTIKGERKDDATEDLTYLSRERGAGSFSRVLQLPVEVDAEKVRATLRDGVLTITLPKAQTAMPRKIRIQS